MIVSVSNIGILYQIFTYLISSDKLCPLVSTRALGIHIEKTPPSNKRLPFNKRCTSKCGTYNKENYSIILLPNPTTICNKYTIKGIIKRFIFITFSLLKMKFRFEKDKDKKKTKFQNLKQFISFAFK